MSNERDNVIHVSFGRDGSHRRATEPRVEDRADGARERSVGRAVATHAEDPVGSTSAGSLPAVDDPLADLYAPDEVARFFGVEPKRLRAWEKKGFVEATVKRGTRRFFTFRDLVGVRAVKGLLESGVPEKSVKRAVDALRRTLPRVTRPLNELRVLADGASIVVVDEHGQFEPQTGQQVLDFSVDRLREDVVRVLRRPLDAEARKTAYEHYLEGCRFDEDPQTMERAAEAYVAALRLDPALGCAITNLGNLRYRQGRVEEAERLYVSAIAVDAEQPEAHYNLGFLELERDRPARALPHLERAVELDPGFADAHYNLASAYDSLGRTDEGLPHWNAYLELEPSGTWAAQARARLRSS